MITTDLHDVSHAVLRRAERQGSIRPGEIREELARAGLPAEQWKNVVAQSRSALRSRQGRYYFKASVSPRLQAEQRLQRAIGRAVRQLLRQHKKSHAQTERRNHGRTDFVQPVKVRTEQERELTLLSRDLSPTGIRLIGTQSLLGQRVQVMLPGPKAEGTACFVVRILWTSAVADGLYENGGMFLEMVEN
jgi:hypothetical protein